MDPTFSNNILNWYTLNGRHDLPWQTPCSAYRVWISEIMLQQTQVVTVIPYFERFMKAIPDVKTLAEASEDEVLSLWSGLGYYSRARNTHKAAKIICNEYGSNFPRTLSALLKLPGIGRTTAGAILALAFKKPVAILDGNVKRVLARYHGIKGWPGDSDVLKLLWEKAEYHTPEKHVAYYTQAIMDIGATVCKRLSPKCDDCPVVEDCYALENDCIDVLPGRKPSKEKSVRAARLLLLINEDNCVYLERRPSSGIWGGLWSLPELSMDEDISEACSRRWGMLVHHSQDGETFRHTFSHYHLDITPCRVSINYPVNGVKEPSQFVWYQPGGDLPGGIPAPVTILLKSFAITGTSI